MPSIEGLMENLPEAGGATVALGGTVISALTGSLTGGLMVLIFLVMLGGYFIITKHILPAHDKHIQSLMASAKDERKAALEDRKAYMDSMNKITTEISILARQIDKHGEILRDVNQFLINERASDIGAGNIRNPPTRHVIP